MPGNWHVRFGERRAETGRRKAARRCAPTLLLRGLRPVAMTAQDGQARAPEPERSEGQAKRRAPESGCLPEGDHPSERSEDCHAPRATGDGPSCERSEDSEEVARRRRRR